MIIPIISTLLVFIGAFAYYTTDVVQLMDSSARRARLKVHIANVETAGRIILLSPGSYECNVVGGVSGCSFSGLSGSGGTKYDGKAPVGSAMYRLGQLAQPLESMFCPQSQVGQGHNGGNNGCGLHISKTPEIVLEPGQSQPKVTMEFKFEDQGSFAPITITVRPSPEVLQTQAVRCNGVFEGFNADGSIQCRDLDLKRAEVGHFISAVDMSTLKPTYSKLPELVDDCNGKNQYLASFKWTGGETYSAKCGMRGDPFGTR